MERGKISPVLFVRSYKKTVCVTSIKQVRHDGVCPQVRMIKNVIHFITKPDLQRGYMWACCRSSIINPVSPSMQFIGFEAMRVCAIPPRTCVTLVPKYIAKPRWLIRLEQ